MKRSIIIDQICEDAEKALEIASGLGYKYVEIHNVFGKTIEACDEKEIEELKRILAKYDMKVSNIASTVFFMCPLYKHYNISLFNPHFYVVEGDVSAHLLALKRACKIANELNCEHVRIFPFRLPDNPELTIVGTDDDMKVIKSHMTQAVYIAEGYNVTLVVENCPYSHLPKGEMTYTLVEMVGSKNLQMLWDPGNSYRAEKNRVPSKYLALNLTEEFDLIKDKIGHIHLKNYEYDSAQAKPFVHRALLKGDIDYNTLLPYVSKSYSNCFSLEPEVTYDETIESMVDLMKL